MYTDRLEKATTKSEVVAIMEQLIEYTGGSIDPKGTQYTPPNNKSDDSPTPNPADTTNPQTIPA